MKREQIIEILEKHLKQSQNLEHGMKLIGIPKEDIPIITDAILALPLDVPTDQEIKDEIFANDPVSDGDPEWIYGFRQGQFSGAKRMRDEIIKRNRVI